MLIFFSTSFSYAQKGGSTKVITIDPAPPCKIEAQYIFNISSPDPTESLGSPPKQVKDLPIATQKELLPFIEINLGKPYTVGKIRLSSPPEQQLKNYSIYASSQPFPAKSQETLFAAGIKESTIKLIMEATTFSGSDSIAFFPPLEAQYFRIQLNGNEPQSLVLSGLELFGVCGSAPPRDPEVSKCDNGGFESNSFSGWIGETGVWRGGKVEMTTKGINASNHNILQVPFIEESNMPITMPCKGNYVAKLGNRFAGNKAERLSYRFTVNQQNAKFFFRYAFVQENAMHVAAGERNPYFEYKVIRVSDNSVRTGKLIEFDPRSPDPFFQRQGSSLFRSWTCVNVDLSAFIGEEFIAQFETADCNQQAHSGYAYIDGLCTSAADNTPITKIIGATRLCSPSDYVFTGENSCNANRSLWTIAQLNPSNGTIIKTCTTEVFGQPGSINIKNEFIKCSTFDDSKRYRITLKVFSDCGEGNTETIETVVIPTKIKYVDAIVCNGYNGEIKLKALNICSSCTYDWSSSFRFVNSKTAEPTFIRGQALPCDQVFEVRATDGDGCVFTQYVKLNTFDGQIVSIDKDVDKTDINSGNPIPKSAYCGYEVKINVNMQTCIPPSKIKILITSQADPNFSKIADFDVINSNGQLVYKAIIPQNLGEDLQNASNKLTATLFFADYGVTSANLNVFGSCNAQFPFTLENRFWYFGYWKDNVVAPGNYIKHGTITAAIPVRNYRDIPTVYPALYSSTAIGTPPLNESLRIVNSTYTFPNQPNPIQYGYGAFLVNIQIGNRWGMTDIIQTYSKVAVPPTITLPNRFLEYEWTKIWDGTYKGKRVQQGVYPMVVSVSNCRVTNAELYRTYITIP